MRCCLVMAMCIESVICYLNVEMKMEVEMVLYGGSSRWIIACPCTPRSQISMTTICLNSDDVSHYWWLVWILCDRPIWRYLLLMPPHPVMNIVLTMLGGLKVIDCLLINLCACISVCSIYSYSVCFDHSQIIRIFFFLSVSQMTKLMWVLFVQWLY